MKQAIIGLDIGGTKIDALLVDDALKPLAQLRRATMSKTPETLFTNVTETVVAVAAQAGYTLAEVAAIGVGIPGQVDTLTGVVQTAVNLNLDTFPLGQRLSQQYGIPVRIENDMHTAAMGVFNHMNSNQPSVSNLAYLGIGTGVAAGIILNGRLHTGTHQMAGEIGHIVFQDDGPLCRCGQRGCLEAIASGPAIVKQAKKLLATQAVDSPQALYQLASEGHFPAQLATERVGKSLARAIQLLLMTYDVGQVVLGGGVTRIGIPFQQSLLTALAQLRRSSALAQKMLLESRVRFLPHDINPGLWGAVELAQQAA